MSRRAIPGNFFWGENSEKVIEIKKRGPFGLKFCHSIQTSIHHYNKINLRNWKDFSWENFYIVFFLFLGLNLEIWSSCRQLRAGCPNMFRRTNLGKLFCTRKEKKWHFSDIFPSFRQNRWSGCVKIQHSTPPNEQMREKILRKFILCIFVFTLGGQNLVHLGQNRSSLSNRVPKTSPIIKFLWIRIQEEEIGNWASFSRTVGQKFRRGYQNCNLNVHRSIYKYYFFSVSVSCFWKSSELGA